MKMQTKTWMAVAAGVAAMGLVAGPAFANPARTDLMNTDTDGTQFQAVAGTPGGNVFVGQVQQQNSAAAAPNGMVQAGTVLNMGGQVFAYVLTPNVNEQVVWLGNLSELDKVNRLPDRSQAALVQRNFASTTIQYVNMGVNQTFFGGNPTAGCQAKIRYQNYSATEQTTNGNLPGAWTQAQGTLVCEEFALQAGVVDGTTRARIKELIGTKSDGTGLRSQFTALAGNLQ